MPFAARKHAGKDLIKNKIELILILYKILGSMTKKCESSASSKKKETKLHAHQGNLDASTAG